MVTSRDAQIVAWLGRIGAAGAEHVQERFGMGRSVTYCRLSSLAAEGMLEHRMVLYGRPGMYSATRRGLRWQDLGRLPAVHVSPTGFEHAWRVAGVAVEVHRELPGWRVLGEREIKAIELAEKRLLASARIGSIGSQALLHRPDLALVSPDGRVVALEVELSVKGSARLERICRGWARARHLEHVYYLAAPAAGRAVGRAIGRVKAQNRVTVLALGDTKALAARELTEKETHDVHA